MILTNFDWSWAKRILVCGGRNFARDGWFTDRLDAQKAAIERRFIQVILYDLCVDTYQKRHWIRKGLTIIHGNAPGADRAAGRWPEESWATVEVFPADWDKYGKAAGAVRNKQMLVEGKPDLVVAFPGGKGTKNMIEQALHAKVPVIKITKGQLGKFNYEFLGFKE